MAWTPQTDKSDFRNGFPISDGSVMSGHAHGEELVLGGRGDSILCDWRPLYL